MAGSLAPKCCYPPSSYPASKFPAIQRLQILEELVLQPSPDHCHLTCSLYFVGGKHWMTNVSFNNEDVRWAMHLPQIATLESEPLV